MKSEFLLAILLAIIVPKIQAQDTALIVKGFCVGAPSPERLEDFLSFMENDLAGNGINTLVLRVDFNYEYDSYPRLRNEHALSEQQVKRLVRTAHRNEIRMIPQINLLGHQSWASCWKFTPILMKHRM